MSTRSAELQSEMMKVAEAALIQNYRQQPMVLERGRGSELFDVTGKRYLDMTAGIAVCGLGHAHPRLAQAISEQAQTLLHVSNLYFNERQIAAAGALVRIAFPSRVFFANSGGEANEAALKLARRYQTIAGQPARQKIIAMEGSFHGRTIATVSVTGQEKYRQGFGALFAPVEFLTYGDDKALATALKDKSACAVLIEPIQGEGGIIVPAPGYLKKVRELCSETGTVLIFDEVQTGIGRTGKWFGYQWDNVEPDVMTLAKGLGGGVPVGALLASPEFAKGLAFADGVVPHASTFGGNPLACAAICATLEIIADEKLLDNCLRMGEHLEKRLQTLVTKHPKKCLSTRGRGLLRGLQIDRPPVPVAGACRERGVLLSAAGKDVIRFAPPLNVSAEHLDEAVAVLDGVIGGLDG